MLYNRTIMKKYNCYSEDFPNLPFSEDEICPKLAERIKKVYENYSYPHCCCRNCCWRHCCCCNRINYYHFGDNIFNFNCCEDNPPTTESEQ